MNLPNILTVLRVLLTFLFIALYCQNDLESRLYALFVFTLASITDYLDGVIARKYNLISNFGKIMDPIADKFLVLSAFFIFMHMNLLAVWMFVVIAAREIFVTGLRLMAMHKGLHLAAEQAGKLKTVLQIVAVYLIMIFTIASDPNAGVAVSQGGLDLFLQVNNILIWLVVIVTLWSGLSFICNNKKELFYVR